MTLNVILITHHDPKRHTNNKSGSCEESEMGSLKGI